jgi:toxin YhaV
VIHGWRIYLHPCFLEQLQRLEADIAAEPPPEPGAPPSSARRVLAAIVALAFDRIPSDPTRAEYRQGSTLGAHRRHWFRAKFGNGRFRLFFRFRSDARVIVYGWVNDEQTLRTYGSRTDAYATFRRMLDAGRPPDDWDALLGQSRPAP